MLKSCRAQSIYAYWTSRRGLVLVSLRTADAFPVVASLPLPPPSLLLSLSLRYFSEGEKRRPEVRLLFASWVLVDGGLGRVQTLWREKKEIKIVNKQAATVESLIDGHRVKNVIS